MRLRIFYMRFKHNLEWRAYILIKIPSLSFWYMGADKHIGESVASIHFMANGLPPSKSIK